MQRPETGDRRRWADAKDRAEQCHRSTPGPGRQINAKLADVVSTEDSQGRRMSRRRERPNPRERLSPTETVMHLTDDIIDSLDIPTLPGNLPDRLVTTLQRRIKALFYYLEASRNNRYAGALELRLVRDAHRAVLTAYELGLDDAEQQYAAFKNLVVELGYERTDVGYRRVD